MCCITGLYRKCTHFISGVFHRQYRCKVEPLKPLYLVLVLGAIGSEKVSLWAATIIGFDCNGRQAGRRAGGGRQLALNARINMVFSM